jgi:hypothetical protein
MKIFLLVFLASGLGLLGFCYWGLCTTAGQATNPEMAGLLPFYAGGLGSTIIVLTGLIFAIRRWRQRRSTSA